MELGPWEQRVLFIVAVAGAVFLLFAKKLGIDIPPTYLLGYSSILGYVLTGRWRGGSSNGNDESTKPRRKKKPPSGGDDA